MTRELIIQNIMNNYDKYGITIDMVEEVIDAGIEEGMSYDLIYLDICRRISEITGEEFICSASDMAKAFNVSDEEMDKIIEEAREELIEAGENPDEYFRSVQSTRYVPCDLSPYEGRYTVDIAKKAIPQIKDELILQYEHEIEKKLNIFL